MMNEWCMGILIVEMTKELIQDLGRTGNIIRKCIIEEGLPSDAELTDAKINDNNHLELTFQDIDTPDGSEKRIAIKVKELTLQ